MRDRRLWHGVAIAVFGCLVLLFARRPVSRESATFEDKSATPNAVATERATPTAVAAKEATAVVAAKEATPTVSASALAALASANSRSRGDCDRARQLLEFETGKEDGIPPLSSDARVARANLTRQFWERKRFGSGARSAIHQHPEERAAWVAQYLAVRGCGPNPEHMSDLVLTGCTTKDVLSSEVTQSVIQIINRLYVYRQCGSWPCANVTDYFTSTFPHLAAVECTDRPNLGLEAGGMTEHVISHYPDFGDKVLFTSSALIRHNRASTATRALLAAEDVVCNALPGTPDWFENPIYGGPVVRAEPTGLGRWMTAMGIWRNWWAAHDVACMGGIVKTTGRLLVGRTNASYLPVHQSLLVDKKPETAFYMERVNSDVFGKSLVPAFLNCRTMAVQDACPPDIPQATINGAIISCGWKSLGHTECIRIPEADKLEFYALRCARLAADKSKAYFGPSAIEDLRHIEERRRANQPIIELDAHSVFLREEWKNSTDPKFVKMSSDPIRKGTVLLPDGRRGNYVWAGY